MIEGNPVVFLLSQFGNIKNCRIAPSLHSESKEAICYPPSVTCWYKEPVDEIDISLLKQKISDFPGRFAWILKEESPNCWILYPEFLDKISRRINENIRGSSAYVMKNEPELGRHSNREFRELIAFLLHEITGEYS
ncbi:hypothetical protein [Synechococcus sp. PCC 7336]|uniref:hypothetical protein n=1 Tax=Synechococcus sp. PCC 7336 TaxID=195250 RepID=UPI0012EA18CD|nr:hypothetical protein [Synechococcus sp. PCC 7336]